MTEQAVRGFSFESNLMRVGPYRLIVAVYAEGPIRWRLMTDDNEVVSEWHDAESVASAEEQAIEYAKTI